MNSLSWTGAAGSVARVLRRLGHARGRRRRANYRYRIVGPDEFDREPGYISIDSPVAKALLKKTRGDDVEVKRPDGVAHFHIVEIDYDESD